MSSQDHRKPLGVLVAGEPVGTVLSTVGGFAELIRRTLGDAWTGPFFEVDLRIGVPLPDPSELAALVITGSAASVTERSPWILRGETYLRTLIDSGLPTLGICFGHQMLGTALGGEVRRNPRGREIGTVDLALTSDDALLAHARPRTRVNTTHVDSITRLPSSAVVIAESALEPYAAVRFSETAWGVQFHPEIDGEVMRHYIAARRESIAQEGLDADAIFESATDTPQGARVLQRFVEIALGTPRE